MKESLYGNILVNKPQIALDTSAFIPALLSKRGAAYRLLMLADSGLFEVNLSVSLVIEYEAVAKRMLDQNQDNDDLHPCTQPGSFRRSQSAGRSLTKSKEVFMLIHIKNRDKPVKNA